MMGEQELAFKDKKKKDMAELWNKMEREGGVKKLQTGIKGFDEMLEGGIPLGRSMLVTGGSGSGKTVILSEFLYRGATMFDEPGVFVTFEERPEDIKKNVKNFGWDYDSLIEQNKLTFVDVSPDEAKEVGQEYDLSPLLVRIKDAIKKTNAKRAVIDGLESLFQQLSNKYAVRGIIFQISNEFKKLGVTSLITAEKAGNGDVLSRYGVAEYVADSAIDMDTEIGQNKILRTIIIKKMRGVGYRTGKVNFDITYDGLRIFPKIPFDRFVAKTDFSNRKQFGIEGFDEALGGGIPQGHMFFVTGNTGTGKTTLGMHFLKNGFDNDEPGVFVTLEEPFEQVKKTAMVHGWDFEEYEQQGKLRFVTVSLIDILPDELLYKIVDAVIDIGAKRVVIDSISTLESATLSPNQVREFMIQLSMFCKTQGITCVLNYLTAESFGATGGQLLSGLTTNEMRLSSIMDGIIILRYVERGQRVKKLLNILKLRGSEHSKNIFEFDIRQEGFIFGEKFEM